MLWIKFRWQHDSLYGLTPLFDFNREGNLPAFYSACALLFAAVLLFVIAGHAWERTIPGAAIGPGSASSSCFLPSTKRLNCTGC